MTKNAAVLGSTGSIGRQSLEVLEKLNIRACALAAAGGNLPLIEEQARRFRPFIIALFDESAAAKLRMRLADTDVKVVSGEEGLCEAAVFPAADTVIAATSGVVGLRPTIAAIEAGKRIALANKETLVCAGDIIMKAAKEHKAEILPVDSEHSAIFQCLNGERQNDVIKRIILTASGGPFRGYSADRLEKVTSDEALRHPNWSMGPKITIDSATLMNKGLEFIEAMHLFGVPAEKIGILIHPESIIHSMVEFCDNAVIAQLGTPDMRLPIQLALTWPLRKPSCAAQLDLTSLSGLTFESPDYDAFPCLALALRTAKEGGTACAVMNAANEEAVRLFLSGKIGFGEIYRLTLSAVSHIGGVKSPNLEDILSADAETRRFVKEKCMR